jgi:glycosyltransferase involved in cell wall biosynthesis
MRRIVVVKESAMTVRALVLVQKPVGVAPHQRFRIEQWEPHLRQAHGIELDYRPFESPSLTRVIYQNGRALEKALFLVWDALRRSGVVGAARSYDVVVILREAALIGPAIYERLLARSGVPIVYDFDDALWAPPKRTVLRANDAFRFLKFSSKTATIARLARVVTVGNEYLASFARRYNRAVHVVPTSIELAAYPAQPALPAGEPFTVVWSGTFSTLGHLELARAPLEELARRRPVCLNVICDRPLPRPFAGVKTRFIPWKAAEEARAMPLPDDEFARGKCACKALQYMAAGRVAVVSPVGINAEIIKDGANGFLATTDREWVSALDRLASSEEMRERVAAAGRSTVERGYSAERSAALFAAAVRAALSSDPVSVAAGGRSAAGGDIDASAPAQEPLDERADEHSGEEHHWQAHR